MNNFQRIVAATDFSDCSATALSYAKGIARKFDAELTLLHANMIAPLVISGTAGPAFAVAAERQADGARAALDAFYACHLADCPGARRLAITGAAPETSLSTSRTLKADLIVMGTRGHTGIKRAILGSVAEAVIRESDRPVLTVRCGTTEHVADVPLFRRILCPVDYSERSRQAYERALVLASAFEAELIVLYVAGEPLGGVIEPEAEIERLRTWMGDPPLAVRAKLLVDRGNAAEQVIFYAKERDVDLLVIGSAEKTVANATVLGSTTDMLTRHAPCPVLTVPGELRRVPPSAIAG